MGYAEIKARDTIERLAEMLSKSYSNLEFPEYDESFVNRICSKWEPHVKIDGLTMPKEHQVSYVWRLEDLAKSLIESGRLGMKNNKNTKYFTERVMGIVSDLKQNIEKYNQTIIA